MNCKPGDLAVIVRSKVRPQCIGFITRVVFFDPSPLDGTPAWRIDPPAPGGGLLRNGVFHMADWIVDASLRPIRDPGEDARDETLNWLPVPTKEIA